MYMDSLCGQGAAARSEKMPWPLMGHGGHMASGVGEDPAEYGAVQAKYSVYVYFLGN